MHIISLIPDVMSLVHEVEGKSVEFLPDEAGKFDVPAEIGAALIKFPHWVQDLGEDAEKAVAVAESDVHGLLAKAEARIAELEAKLTKKAPAKAAAAKKTASAATPAAPDAKPAAETPSA